VIIERALGRNGAGSCCGVQLVQRHETAGSAAGVVGVIVVLLMMARVTETLRYLRVWREEPHPAGHKRSSLVLVGGAASGRTKNCICEHSTHITEHSTSLIVTHITEHSRSLIVTHITGSMYFYVRGNGFESTTISIS
jgi:hypothetical protein